MNSSKLELLMCRIILLLGILFFFVCSISRVIAFDEGFYLMAAKLVSQGKVIYSDFFYPQMPILPYIYSLIHPISTDHAWLTARLFTAFLGSLIIIIIYKECSFRSKPFFGSLGVLLFCLSSMSFPWFTVVKTYALSIVLLITSVYFFSQADKNSLKLNKKLLFSGIFLGLSICSRLTMVVCIAPMLFIFLIEKKTIRQITTWGIGLFIGLLPALPFFINNPEIFLFNNFGYHQIRTGESAEAILKSKLHILKVILGIRPSEQYESFQFAALLYIFILATFFELFRSRKLTIFTCLGWTLLIAAFIPSPAYLQYFCVTIPFIVISIVRFISFGGDFNNIIKRACFAFFILFYVYFGIADINRYLVQGSGVIGIRNLAKATFYKPLRMDSVGQEISSSIAYVNQPVLSLWPGFLLSSNATPITGLENHFGWKVSNRLSGDERSKYKIASINDLDIIINGGDLNLIIIPEFGVASDPIFKTILNSDQYKLRSVSIPPGVRLYERK